MWLLIHARIEVKSFSQRALIAFLCLLQGHIKVKSSKIVAYYWNLKVVMVSTLSSLVTTKLEPWRPWNFNDENSVSVVLLWFGLGMTVIWMSGQWSIFVLPIYLSFCVYQNALIKDLSAKIASPKGYITADILHLFLEPQRYLSFNWFSTFELVRRNSAWNLLIYWMMIASIKYPIS